jgi:hypothetical protein
LAAGLVYLYQVEVLASGFGAWFLPIFLLLMAGVVPIGDSRSPRGSSPMGGAIAATAPLAVAWAATALGMSLAAGVSAIDVVLLFLVAWAVIAVGRVIGRAMSAMRAA